MNVQEEILHYPRVGIGCGSVKVLNVMGKSQTGKLSYRGTGCVICSISLVLFFDSS